MQIEVKFSLPMSPGSICSDQRGQFGGGSVMIWAGISLHTKTPMVPIHQNLNAARYQNLVLQPAAIPHIRANRGMVLMQNNLAELERDLINTWNNLPQRVLCNYVNSMRSRCVAVIRANRGHTRY